MTRIDWDDLRYFLAVHRSGTLAGAASELRINATTVGRRLTALEEQVHTRLFDRTPDGYALTPAGLDLLPRAERMESEALAVEREVSGADQRPSGLVRVSVTEMLATRFLVPHLPRFNERYPEILIDLNCTTRSVNLGRREADIALRLARPHEDNVVTKRLASIHLSLYASNGYLAERGAPEDAERSLNGHRAILFASSRAFSLENAWFEARLDGAHVVLRSDSVSSIYSAAAAGLGLALLPTVVADADSSLTRIRTETGPEPRVVWQTVHVDLQRSARIRAVLDFFTGIIAPAMPGPPG
ncbi:MAG TPA: LysR family transcriptional regulator [Polyangiaceae bacterium]|nr:LysR family transcriptional regulator [Polyangiaceae bacterium]